MKKLQLLIATFGVAFFLLHSCSRETQPFEPPTVSKFLGQYTGKEDILSFATNKIMDSKDAKVKVTQINNESLSVIYTYSNAETFNFTANIDGAYEFKVPYQKTQNPSIGFRGYGKISDNVLSVHIEKDSSKMYYEYVGKK